MEGSVIIVKGSNVIRLNSPSIVSTMTNIVFFDSAEQQSAGVDLRSKVHFLPFIQSDRAFLSVDGLNPTANQTLDVTFREATPTEIQNGQIQMTVKININNGQHHSGWDLTGGSIRTGDKINIFQSEDDRLIGDWHASGSLFTPTAMTISREEALTFPIVSSVESQFRLLN